MDEAIRRSIIDRIDNLAEDLVSVSRAIHANPELAFQEHFACDLLSRTLGAHDLPVSTRVYSLETSFESSFSGGAGPTVALLAEYDALPGIGHACGHNLIATAALGATLGLHAVRDRLPGSVKLLGTPAEEKGGGKALMARAGAFDGIDAALMIHPAGVNLTTMPCICVAEVEVIYHGRSAHASAMPHKGVNALDGLLLAYQAISNLRQHIRDQERIHGIVTDGGRAPNIVPERAAGEFYVRAVNERDLAALTQVSGVGKKTAERISLELADRVRDLALVRAGAPGASPALEGAVSALVSLGFSFAEADASVRKALAEGDGQSTEALIRKALAGG